MLGTKTNIYRILWAMPASGAASYTIHLSAHLFLSSMSQLSINKPLFIIILVIYSSMSPGLSVSEDCWPSFFPVTAASRMKFMKLGSKPDCFQTDGNDVRFAATELPSDVIITVQAVSFHLHKFPLLSKSGLLQKLLPNSDHHISIPDIPGGSPAFEICAKFCYGITLTVNPYNVLAVHSASEYLQMHETVQKGNLIYKIDVFLNSTIFRSWKDSIILLQTTKSADNPKLINRVVDSIASKASILDTSKVEWSYGYNHRKLPADPSWDGVNKRQIVPQDWWVQDLCDLDIEFYKRVIVAIRSKERVSDEVIGEALKAYAYASLSGLSVSDTTTVQGGANMKTRSLVESIVWLLPTEVGSVSCSFLLKLLRASAILECGKNCKKQLIRRIGRRLEEASVPDLLIPSTNHLEAAAVDTCPFYDVDMVINMLEEFVMQGNPDSGEVQEMTTPTSISAASKLCVSKLIDGYLGEIAEDPNLPLMKFMCLAEMASCGVSKPVHDALYHAIDLYLKEHPSLGKLEKKRICRLMECKKLSTNARRHAVQNERLPLRVIVQVLFLEQVRLATEGGGVELRGCVNGGSSGSSIMSAGTVVNTEDEWDGGAHRARDMKQVGGESERMSSTGGCHDHNKEKKGMKMPKRVLSKLWSGRSHGGVGNVSSDTSDSPASTNIEESKSTRSGNTRRSR